jgi:hypothetical protein
MVPDQAAAAVHSQLTDLIGRSRAGLADSFRPPGARMTLSSDRNVFTVNRIVRLLCAEQSVHITSVD